MRLTRLLTNKEIKLANDYSTREEVKRKKGDYTILENVKPFDAVNKLGLLEDLMEIISNKPIDIGLNLGSVISNEPERYSITFYDLTEEEIDLLKEELEWKL